MQESVSIPANSTNANVLVGQKFDRSPGDALGAIYQTGSAIGLRSSVNVGGATAADTNDVGAANRVPNDRDDLLVDDWPAPEGDLIQVRVENTTAAALIYFYKVVLQEAILT